MSPFDIGVLLLTLAGVVLSWRRAPPTPPSQASVITGAGAVFLLALGGLLLFHQRADPSWTPRGADWDFWLGSATALRGRLDTYPPSRWPLFGLLASGMDQLLPTPLFVDAQITSLALGALTAASLFVAGSVLLSRSAGLTAAVLGLTLPLTHLMLGWVSAYPLWASATALTIAGLAAALEWPHAGWWAACGLGYAGIAAAMPKGFGPALAVSGPLLLALGMTRSWRPWLAFLIPVLLLALVYRLLPVELMSIEGAVHLHRVSEQTVLTPAQHLAERSAATEGWVFGRSRGPVSTWRALRFFTDKPLDASTGATLSAVLSRNSGKLPAAAPSLSWLHLGWAGLGLVVGALSAARRRPRQLWTWLALVALLSSFLPTILVNLNLRFLLPAFVLLTLPFVAPLGRSPLTALGLLLAALLPGSPWRDPVPELPTEARASASMVATWYAVDALDLDAPEPLVPVTMVSATGRHSLFAIDARPGWEHWSQEDAPQGVAKRPGWLVVQSLQNHDRQELSDAPPSRPGPPQVGDRVPTRTAQLADFTLTLYPPATP